MAYLSRQEREIQIIDGAIRFFSERGLSAQTRELSASMGIAQPLLYRYFPSKQALIERIFVEAFLNRWDRSWKAMVADQSAPLDDRIRRFYHGFASYILTREWVRLFFHSELEGHHYSKKVLQKLKDEIFTAFCQSLRLQYGYPSAKSAPITAAELNLVVDLHGLILYKYVRKYVYEVRLTDSLDVTVDRFLAALHTTTPPLLKSLFDSASTK